VEAQQMLYNLPDDTNTPSLPNETHFLAPLISTLTAGSCRMSEPDDALVPTTELSEIADKRMSLTLQLKLIVPILSIRPSWIKRHYIPRIYRPAVPFKRVSRFLSHPFLWNALSAGLVLIVFVVWRGQINDMNVLP
jgi:hypothetical protein